MPSGSIVPGPPTCTTGAPLATIHWPSTFDAGGRPTRTTTSGRCAAAKAVSRSTTSNAATAPAIDRHPDVGSASTGHPDRAESSATASAVMPLRPPATMMPRPAQQRRRTGVIGVLRRTRRRIGVRRVVRRRRRERTDRAEQRIAEGQVQVHRAARRGRQAAGGEGAPRALLGGLGDARVVEPPHRAAEQVGLVDGLGGADADQLRRPIGGEHEHRHVRQAGLDDRGVEVHRRGPAGAQQQRRASRRGRGRGRRTPPPARRAPRAPPGRRERRSPAPSGCCASPAPPLRGRRHDGPIRRPAWRRTSPAPPRRTRSDSSPPDDTALGWRHGG